MRTTGRILVFMLVLFSHFIGETDVWFHILVYVTIAILSSLLFVQFLKNKKPFHVNIPDILILCFTIYLFLINIFNDNFWGNDRLYNLLIILLLYFAFSFLYKKDKGILLFIFYGLLAGLVVELIIGFGQLFGVFSNSDSKFVLGGLFGNPGAFAGYLAIISPFLLVFILQRKQFFKSENSGYAITFSFCASACLILLSNSRGAWIACFAGLFFVLNQRYKVIYRLMGLLKTTATKAVAVIALVSVITVVFFGLYLYKKESAFGRLFIWKVSKEMAYEKPFFGSGFGAFEAEYGKVQAAYFLSNKGSDSEKQVADYVTCAYNEYLEMLIESGVIGLFLFLGILCFALINRHVGKPPIYRTAAKASLISLLVLCSVSYPFRLMPNLLLLVIFLFVIFRTGRYRTIVIARHGYGKAVAFVWLIALSGLIYCSSRYVYGVYHFRNGYAKVLNNDFDGGIIDYKKAYAILDTDGKFLFYYGSALYLKHDYLASIGFLRQAITLRSDPNAFITLGRSLQQLNRYREAEKAYKMATGITPAKLYPKYLLVKLYFEMQQTGKALAMAESIITAKEKVPTTAGAEIKSEIRELVAQYNRANVKPLKQNL